MAIERVNKLIDTLGALIDGEFSGYIKINFSQGSLGRVEKFEEIDGEEVLSPKTEMAIGKGSFIKEGSCQE